MNNQEILIRNLEKKTHTFWLKESVILQYITLAIILFNTIAQQNALVGIAVILLLVSIENSNRGHDHE